MGWPGRHHRVIKEGRPVGSMNKIGILFLSVLYALAAHASSTEKAKASLGVTLGFALGGALIMVGGELVRRGSMPDIYGISTKPGWIMFTLGALCLVVTSCLY